MKYLVLIASLVLPLLFAAKAQFAGFENKGLVGVGRIPAGQFDKAGNGTNDTLGGFSALAVDNSSLTYIRGRISGTLYGLPDRGFGDGSTDYRPRLEVYRFSIDPYYGAAATTQDQILLTNSQTILLTYDNGIPFTGFDAGDSNNVTVPQAATSSPGGGRRAIDPEGLVLLPDGSWWISDEYGPALFRFNAAGAFQEMILPPAALLPFQGAYPGKLNFSAIALPTSGRRNNRGLEGLSLTLDGKRLIAFLQSPAAQDEGGGNTGRNTRVLQIDAERNSPTYGKTLVEHIYQLTLNGSAETNRHTPVSEVLALSSTTFLALERDSLGRGIGTNKPIYKKIVLFSTLGATNIAGLAYDQAKDAPGQLSLPAESLPSSIKPVTRQDFIDLLDSTQLGKFGLNSTSNPEINTNALSEKWEALGLVPMDDPQFPNDYLLLIGNDNDFKVPLVYHNGQIVGTNTIAVDIMLLAYRVTLPGMDASRSPNVPPAGIFTVPAGPTFAMGPLPIQIHVNDEDGIVVRAEFLLDGVKIGEASQFPFVVNQASAAIGSHTYGMRLTDNDGAVSEFSKTVQITAQNTAPTVALTSPAAGSMAAPYTLKLAVNTGDSDGFVTRIDYLDATGLIGSSTNAPFSMIVSNFTVGRHSLRAVSTDNLGLMATSAPVSIEVTRTSKSSAWKNDSSPK